MGHYHERVTFEGPSGQLSGTLHVPDGELKGAVVQAHCFTCSKSFKGTRHLATGIEDGGYAVLRFDFTGLGESEGEFTETSVTSNVGDIVAAAGYVAQRGLEPSALVGHSLGGAATLLAAADVPRARAVVAVAAPFRPDHVRHLFDTEDIETALQAGHVTAKIAGRPFQVSSEFFRDLQTHCSPERIAALGRPLLVVHGTADRIVGIEESERIFDAAHQPRWFAAIPEADHLLVQTHHAARAASAIVTFLDAVM